MNQQRATPYKTEQDKPETKYEVDKTGDVKITQIVKTTSWWKYREFLSLMRENESALEQTKQNYSEEFIEKMKKQEKEIEKEIEIMSPIMEESEKLSQEEYKKQRHEGLKNSVIEEITSKEFNSNWWNNVWMRTKPEIKEPIFKELTEEQKKKVLRCIRKLKR